MHFLDKGCVITGNDDRMIAFPRKQPAIALTAYARSEDVESVLSAGFDLHLAKPVDLNLLLTAVANLARTSRPSSVP